MLEDRCLLTGGFTVVPVVPPSLPLITSETGTTAQFTIQLT